MKLNKILLSILGLSMVLVSCENAEFLDRKPYSQTYGRLLNSTNTWVSSYFVEDGSFIRFKTLSVGYTLQNAALKRAGIGMLRFSVAADNLYIWSNYSGMDPDVSSSNSLFTGFDRLSYPKARTVTFGINATF